MTNQEKPDGLDPGILSRDGFLGSDTRSAREIIEADDLTVRELGLTHRQIARELDRVTKAAMHSCGNPVRLEDDLVATYRESMGRIPCPWGCGPQAKGEIELVDKGAELRLLFTPLSVHLIAEHGFYEGKGSRWRIEPDIAAKIFNLA